MQACTGGPAQAVTARCLPRSLRRWCRQLQPLQHHATNTSELELSLHSRQHRLFPSQHVLLGRAGLRLAVLGVAVGTAADGREAAATVVLLAQGAETTPAPWARTRAAPAKIAAATEEAAAAAGIHCAACPLRPYTATATAMQRALAWASALVLVALRAAGTRPVQPDRI